MELAGVEPKIRASTRLNAESYKIRKRLRNEIVVKLPKVTFFSIAGLVCHKLGLLRNFLKIFMRRQLIFMEIILI